MVSAYRGLVAGAVLVTVVLASGSAHATDQGITGKKLLVKTGKIVLLSKDASISIAGSDKAGSPVQRIVPSSKRRPSTPLG